MTDRDNTVKKGFEVFTKIFMKYEMYGKQPRDMGHGIKINASNVHTIEAIGKGYANTVTSLSSYFMVTKGAVSQVVSKLHKARYIKKIESTNKMVILELTALGRQVLKAHDKHHLSVIDKIKTLEKKYSKKELDIFLQILSDVDYYFGEFIDDMKK
jgi:DNA-binding MarR family transcriptional regulator